MQRDAIDHAEYHCLRWDLAYQGVEDLAKTVDVIRINLSQTLNDSWVEIGVGNY